MKTISTVRLINKSMYVLINQDLAKQLNIAIGDSLIFTIDSVQKNKNQETEKEFQYMKCLDCNNLFYSLDDIPYCNICGNENNLEVIESHE